MSRKLGEDPIQDVRDLVAFALGYLDHFGGDIAKINVGEGKAAIIIIGDPELAAEVLSAIAEIEARPERDEPCSR